MFLTQQYIFQQIFHFENSFTLDARRETQEGPPQDHVATDSGERNQGDGEDLGRHQAYGKGPADVEGACYCPTYQLEHTNLVSNKLIRV